MAICSCNTGFSNPGYSCTVNGQVISASIFFNRYKTDGTFNGIDFEAEAVDGVLPASVIESRINDANPDDRWYPVGTFENVVDERAENITQTFNSGNSVKIKDGIRSFSALLIKKSPDYAGKLESFACGDIAVMHIDTDGNLIGESLDGNFLRGISIDNNTFSAIYAKTTDTEVSAINLSYAYSQTVDDQNLSLIGANENATDMKNVRGLLDSVLSYQTTPTITTSVVKAEVIYGMSISDKIVLKSLSLADFSVQNVTQSSSVTIDSVDTTQSSSGVYTISYSSGVSSSDVIEVSATATGYEIKSVLGTVS